MCLFICHNSWGIFPMDYNIEPYLEAEKVVLRHQIATPLNPVTMNPFGPLVEKILKDPKKRIRDEFKIPPYFYPNVKFWFTVYTQYSSHQFLIHDKRDLTTIIDAIDFSQLEESPINKYVKVKIQNDFAKNHVKGLKKAINNLRKNSVPKNKTEEKILLALKDKLPKDKKEWPYYFSQLNRNLRVQTGQRDMVYLGLMAAIPYKKFILDHFKAFELPPELLALAFLESSFNPYAESKVGAMGVWQFMDYTGKHFMKVNKKEDDRKDPLISSVAAMHLSKENYRILKRWDLAITAYNSGAGHLIKARRKLKKSRPSLEEVFTTYKSEHHGFASKNFYASFLALSYALAYQNELFILDDVKAYFGKNKVGDIRPWVSKCSFVPKKIFKLLPAYTKGINRHLLKTNHKYPKGTVLLTDRKLTARKWYSPKPTEIRRNYPKYWSRLVKKQKCL